MSWINTSPTEALLTAVKSWATPMWTGLANVYDFNSDFQRWRPSIAGGEAWGDESLSPRERSILTLGMVAAIGKMDEFANHLRGAPANGLTPNGLRAVLVQIAKYCGIPVSADCFPGGRHNSQPEQGIKELLHV